MMEEISTEKLSLFFIQNIDKAKTMLYASRTGDKEEAEKLRQDLLLRLKLLGK